MLLSTGTHASWGSSVSAQHRLRRQLQRVDPGTRGAVLLLLAVVAVDLLSGAPVLPGSLLAVVPFLVGLRSPWWWALSAGGLATVTAVALGMCGHESAVLVVVTGAAILAVTAVAAAAGWHRSAQVARLADLSLLTDVAWEAVQRPLPTRVGCLALAGRHQPTTTAAGAGDLFDVAETGHGTRILVGELRGAGSQTLRLAGIVLGAYQHIAYEHEQLPEVAAELRRAVSRWAPPGALVTVVLAEHRDGVLTVVNCGHPAPVLLLHAGATVAADPPAASSSLDDLGPPAARSWRVEPGDRLLLCTQAPIDAHARSRGAATLARQLAHRGPLADVLARLHGPAHDWPGALVLAEYTGSPGAGSAIPVQRVHPPAVWPASARP